MFFFRNRRQERESYSVTIDNTKSPFYQWTLYTTCLESEDDEDEDQEEEKDPLKLPRFDRYKQRIRCLLAFIPSEVSRVAIEHYSFNSKNTEAQTQLIELGGCLREAILNQLIQRHPRTYAVYEIPPATIKKCFALNGRAKKEDMYRAYEQIYYLPSLYQALNLTSRNYTKIPHPIEDLVDSLAVAMTGLRLFCP